MQAVVAPSPRPSSSTTPRRSSRWCAALHNAVGRVAGRGRPHAGRRPQGELARANATDDVPTTGAAAISSPTCSAGSSAPPCATSRIAPAPGPGGGSVRRANKPALPQGGRNAGGKTPARGLDDYAATPFITAYITGTTNDTNRNVGRQWSDNSQLHCWSCVHGTGEPPVASSPNPLDTP